MWFGFSLLRPLANGHGSLRTGRHWGGSHECREPYSRAIGPCRKRSRLARHAMPVALSCAIRKVAQGPVRQRPKLSSPGIRRVSNTEHIADRLGHASASFTLDRNGHSAAEGLVRAARSTAGLVWGEVPSLAVVRRAKRCDSEICVRAAPISASSSSPSSPSSSAALSACHHAFSLPFSGPSEWATSLAEDSAAALALSMVPGGLGLAPLRRVGTLDSAGVWPLVTLIGHQSLWSIS